MSELLLGVPHSQDNITPMNPAQSVREMFTKVSLPIAVW